MCIVMHVKYHHNFRKYIQVVVQSSSQEALDISEQEMTVDNPDFELVSLINQGLYTVWDFSAYFISGQCRLYDSLILIKQQWREVYQ